MEVRFTAVSPDRIQVDLEHRNIDRHGEGWEKMRDAVGSPNGWNLQRFADAAKADRGRRPGLARSWALFNVDATVNGAQVTIRLLVVSS